MRLCPVRNDHRERGFARARRAPEDDRREKFVGLDGAPQELAFTDDVLLPDEFVERARANARRKRRFILLQFAAMVLE